MKADVKPTTNAAKLVAAIRALGVDKYMQPVSINTKDLATATGIAAASIQASLDPAVKRGDVVVCKVTPAAGHSYNEWRAGPGVPPTEFKPLNTKRAGVALRTPARTSAPAVPLSTPKPGVTSIEPATLGKPQRAVGTTPAAGDQGPPPVAPAVTAAKATPEPTTRARMKKEPTARKAPAGDVAPRPQHTNGNDGISLRIDHDGTLLIATDEGVLEIDPKQSRRLGHFMADTHGVWNPF